MKIDTLALDSLGIASLAPQNQVLRVEEPAARKAGGVVESVEALIDKLRNEAKVI